MIERRQIERWQLTETSSKSSVKATHGTAIQRFFTELEFPIVSVVADARYAAIVCMNPRLRVLCARSVFLKRCAEDAEKQSLVLDAFAAACREHIPTTLVIQREFYSRLDIAARHIADAACRSARSAGMRVVQTPIAHGLRRLERDPDVEATTPIRELIDRYPEVRERLAPGGKLRLRDSEHWRQHRAFALAFHLAHEAAVAAIVRAVGDREPTTSSPL